MVSSNARRYRKGLRRTKVLLPFIMKEVKSVFEELASDELLEKCKHGGTQNANEAFHHLIWARCPKTVFVGRKRIDIAVAQAKGVYNYGESSRQKVFDILGLPVGSYTKCGHRLMDKRRVVKSIEACANAVRQRRQEKRIGETQGMDCVNS